MIEPRTASANRNAVDSAADLLHPVAPPVPAAVEDWLGQTALMYGVPFEHLLPDSRMLPPESFRFFYIDSNWVESLVDGAFSTGVHSDRDIRFHRVLQDQVRSATDRAAGKVRAQLRGEGREPSIVPAPSGTQIRAGFLLRSSLVSGFPGMEVEAFDGTTDAAPKLPPLRIERLAPDLLLAIFPKIPGLVRLNEPAEGFHFGTSAGQLGGVREVGKFAGPAASNRTAPGVDVPFRDRAAGVLDVHELARRLAARLNLTESTFTSAQFAFQMIDPPDQKSWVERPAQQV